MFLALYAFSCLFCWIGQFFNYELYEILDSYLGFFPKFIDSKYTYDVLLNGVETTTGYLIAALICAIVGFNLKDKIEKVRLWDLKVQQNYLEKNIKKIFKQEAIKKSQEIIEERKDYRLYALFEIVLDTQSYNNISKEKLAPLKLKYTNMMAEKLKEKYKKINFILDDRIFMTINDFRDFDSLIYDMKKIYRVFYNLDEQRSIETNFLFSFWCDTISKGRSYALMLLQRINDLRNLNKILLDINVKKNCSFEQNSNFYFIPFGIVKVDDVEDYTKDMDIELFKLQSK